jgi:hypothetical protein
MLKLYFRLFTYLIETLQKSINKLTMASNFHFIDGKNYLFKFYQHLILSKKLQISGIMDIY